MGTGQELRGLRAESRIFTINGTEAVGRQDDELGGLGRLDEAAVVPIQQGPELGMQQTAEAGPSGSLGLDGAISLPSISR